MQSMIKLTVKLSCNKKFRNGAPNITLLKQGCTTLFSQNNRLQRNESYKKDKKETDK